MLASSSRMAQFVQLSLQETFLPPRQKVTRSAGSSSVLTRQQRLKLKNITSRSVNPRLSVNTPRGAPVDQGRKGTESERNAFKVSAASAAAVPEPAGPGSARSVAAAILPSLALVTPKGLRNSTARGTGFVVAAPSGVEDGGAIFLLTAAHVAAPGRRLEVTFGVAAFASGSAGECASPPGSFPASLVARAPSDDVALIRVERTGAVRGDGGAARAAPLQLRDGDLALGELCFASGFAGGIRGPAFTMGIVSGMADAFPSMSDTASEDKSEEDNSEDATEFPREAPRYVVTDAGMAGGMSGGPLLDGEGCVIGVNCLVRPELRSLGNYAVSTAVCLDFLRGVDARAAGPDRAAVRLVLFNDRMNTRQRVADALKTAAGLDEEASNEVMMAAHTTGRGVVQQFGLEEEEAAEAMLQQLRKMDLLVEVEDVFADEATTSAA